jgi:hypothetical protein
MHERTLQEGRLDTIQ